MNEHCASVSDSVEVIIRALFSQEPTIRELAAIAHAVLIRRRDHECYLRAEDRLLDAARRWLEDARAQHDDKELIDAFLDSLERSDGPP